MTASARFAFRCRPLCFLSMFVSVMLYSGQTMAGPDDATASLAGTWRFRLDPNKVGIEQKWHATRLPQEIKLPGTTDEAKLGLPNPAKPSLDGLYRPNVYTGPAWYQRDIEIPAGWQGKRVELLLERVHWETRVWLDGREIGTQDSLIAPQVHDLGMGITPGKHTLTIRVDNSVKFNLGTFVSILFGGTLTNLNGIVGKIELRAVDPVSIECVEVYSDIDRKLIKVSVFAKNPSGKMLVSGVTLTVSDKSNGATVASREYMFSSNADWPVCTVELPLGDSVKLWDEFSPNLYELTVRLHRGGQSGASEQKVTFGMRKLEIRGTQFVLNGRPIFLRGTLECAVFPLTGYPPTDILAWRRIFHVLKSYGLNFMRFHSWCPPEAAFAAADIEGVYLQIEGPEANIHINRHLPIGQFMEQELLRIVRTYGNHPSFCLMTLGNEHSGIGDTLDYWVEMLIREDPRHLYSSSSDGQKTAHRQFTEGGPRGVHGPQTERDFRNELARQDRPLMGHEIGQWTFFPNFDEIPKYTGVFQAKNFELVRDDLAKKHLLDLAPQFVQSTGRQAVLLYKEEIEVLLRTPNNPGFSLLDLHDYPSQGTALVGPLDPFWDSKGFVTPQQHTRYCGPTVPLLRLKKRTFTSDETLTAVAEIAHFGPHDFIACPGWTIRDEKGTVVAEGELKSHDIPTGKLSPLGQIEASLAKAPAPRKLTISLSLKGTPIANEWEIWVYPPKVHLDPPKGLLVSNVWNEDVKATLAQGGRALLFASGSSSESLPGRFLPVFWSPVWFPTQKPNAMGILCDPKHPALADFPTEFYSNWQWYELLDHSRSIILDDTPAEFRPIVQVIDNFARNHKLGVVFEARVGTGRLLVCGIDLPSLVENQPAARQLLASLQQYAGSEAFQPKSELSAATVDKLFAAAVQPARAKAPETPPQSAIAVPSAEDLVQRIKRQHPRLLIDAAGFESLRKRIDTDPVLKQWDIALRRDADRYLTAKLPEHVMPDGLRLLDTSRRMVQHSYTLAMAYRLHGDRRYVDRLWQELQTVARFPDFNPRHFLDTAEMTHGLAIAYDWLYDQWSEPQRETIRKAIVELGLKPGMKVYESRGGWHRSVHNWNQVCNGGLTVGALAIGDEEPELCGKILHHALTSVQLAMRSYAPDGGWGEGPGYWAYATSYNVAMLACLESAMGTDFGLSKFPGFDQTALFPLYMTGPNDRCFNFADASDRAERADCLLWLGRRFNLPAATWMGAATRRPTAAAMIWYQSPGKDPIAAGLPLDKYWRNVEVATLRSRWNDPQALFVGVEARSHTFNHQHLDIGSFVFDALGQRWAVDLGRDDYNLPGYFGGERYNYYRLRAEGHNTLVIAGPLYSGEAAGPDQDPQAACGIRRFASKPERAFAVADLTGAYSKRAKHVERGVALVDRRYLIVQDEIEAVKADIWWFMHTPAAVRLEGDGRKAMLELGGKQLEARILEPALARFEVRPAEPLPTSPNPAGQKSNDGVRKLAIHLPDTQRLRLTVVFIPRDGQGEVALPKVRPLAEW